MPPSGPRTAPENSDARGMTMAIGRRPPVDLRDVAGEAVEHRPIEVGRRMQVLDEETDQQRERQADGREDPRVRDHEVVLPEEIVDGLVDDQPGEDGDRADDRDDDDVDVRMDRLRLRDGGLLVTRGTSPTRSSNAGCPRYRWSACPCRPTLRAGFRACAGPVDHVAPNDGLPGHGPVRLRVSRLDHAQGRDVRQPFRAVSRHASVRSVRSRSSSMRRRSAVTQP